MDTLRSIPSAAAQANNQSASITPTEYSTGSATKATTAPSIDHSNALIIDEAVSSSSKNDTYDNLNPSLEISADIPDKLTQEEDLHQPGSIGVGLGNIGIGSELGIGGGVGIGGSLGIGGGPLGSRERAATPHQPGSIGVGLGNIGIGSGLGIGGGVGVGGPAGIGGGISKIAVKHEHSSKDESLPTDSYTTSGRSAMFSKINQQQEEEKILEQEMTENLRMSEQVLKEDSQLSKNNLAGSEVTIPEVIV